MSSFPPSIAITVGRWRGQAGAFPATMAAPTEDGRPSPAGNIRSYLQSGQQPVPISRVAAEAPVAAIASATVVRAIIRVFMRFSPDPSSGMSTVHPPIAKRRACIRLESQHEVVA